MSILERRLQVLIDGPRYDRLAQEAERSGRSVGAVVREAIDLRFPDNETSSRQAARALLDLTSSIDGRRGEGPGELKDAYAAELASKASSG